MNKYILHFLMNYYIHAWVHKLGIWAVIILTTMQ